MLNRVNCFYKLTPACYSDVWDELVENGYEDLDEHYTIATDADGEMVTADNIDVDFIATTDIVSTVGGRGGEVRAFTKTITVFVDKADGVWFNADDFEEYFC